MNQQCQIYKIKSKCKKSTYQEEYWIRQLNNGKLVTLCVSTLFRWGNFEIILNQEERKDILEKKKYYIK